MSKKTTKSGSIRANEYLPSSEAGDLLELMNSVMAQHESLGIRSPIKFAEINKMKKLMNGPSSQTKQSPSYRYKGGQA